MKKRILSFALAVLMIASLLPVSASADNTDAVGGTCGEALEWTLKDGVLTISGTGEMYDYNYYDNTSPWSGARSKIVDVVLDDGITKIGSGAFYDCNSLRSISIPNSVTRISYGAFLYCDSLRSANIPSGVTSIEGQTFSGCGALESVTIPNSVTYIGAEAFADCRSLESVVIPEGVTYIDFGAFTRCHRLKSISLPDSLTNIEWEAFYSCESLEDITIPGNVTYIGGRAFSYCGIKSLNIPASLNRFNRGMIEGCDKLEVINVSDDNQEFSSVNGVLYNKDKTEIKVYPEGAAQEAYSIPEGVTHISYRAFEDCTNLKTIDIPSSVTGIGFSAFYHCTGLESIYIPDSVEAMDGINGIFERCDNLKAINVGENNQAFSSVNGVLYSKDKTQLWLAPAGLEQESYKVPNGVTEISYYAFRDCTKLKSVSLPEGLTHIDDCAFAYSGLESINIPDSVAYISWAAFRNTNLETITISEGVKYVAITNYFEDGAFEGCNKLKAINVSENNQYYSSDNGALYNKEKTELLLIPRAFEHESYTIPEGVTQITYRAFQNKENLKNLGLPGSIKEIYSEQFNSFYALETVTLGNGITKIGNRAFEYCTNLKSINIPDTVTVIGSSAFGECLSLVSIDIPKSVTYICEDSFKCYGESSLKAINVDENNLYYSSDDGILYDKEKTQLMLCPMRYAGESYTVPESVTSISYYAFEGCEKIKKLTLPSGLKSIGDNAFQACTNLESVNIPDGVTDLGSTPFSYCDNIKEISVGENNPSYSSENGVLYNKDKTVLIKYTAGSEAQSYTIPESVNKLDWASFNGCQKLKILNIPAGTTIIPTSVFEGAFSLTTINVDENNPNFSSIDGVLFDKDKVTVMQYPASREAESYVIPEGVTGIRNDNPFSPPFMGCKNLKSVTLPASMKTVQDYAFSYCYSLESITLSDSIKSIENAAFYECNNLQSITLPDGLTNIGYSAFWKCSSLKSMILPDSVTQVGTGAFGMCTSLQKLVWSRSATEFNTGVFYRCYNLEGVYIPVTVTEFSFTVFGDEDLPDYDKNVYYEGTPEQWSMINRNGQFTKATIHYNHKDEHNFGEWTVVKAATCTENGTETRSCSHCDLIESREVEALGHDIEHHDSKAATCTDKGWESYDTCSRCDYTTYKEIASLGHKYGNAVTAPTCTDKGFTTHTCAVCGNSYKDSYTDALGHDYAKGKCTRCGAIDPDYIPAPDVKITTTSTGKPNISWTAVNGVVKYWIYRSTDGKNFKYYDSITSTSYTNLSTNVGTIYYYKVKSVNANGAESDFSEVVSIRCTPAAPTLSITTASGKPKISWNAVDGATRYWIYRSTDGQNYEFYDGTVSTSYTNTSATVGQAYYYKVKAIAAVNGQNVASALSAAKSIRCNPAAPSLSITTSNGKPKISWEAVDGAAKYWIYRSTDGKNFSYYDTITKTAYTNISTDAGTTYYYKVRAVSENDAISVLSAAKSVQCRPGTPNLIIGTSAGKPNITWNTVDDAVKYWIYRSTDGKNFKYYDSTTSNNYTNISTDIGTTYYYKAQAVAVVDGKNVTSDISAATNGILCRPAAPALSIERSNGKPRLRWKAITGADEYFIYRSTDGVNFNYYDSTTSTSYTNTGAASGTKYYYRVKAVKVVNGENILSALSATKSLFTTLAKPGVSITTSDGKPRITWKAVTGADKYYIYRSTDGTNYSYYDSTTSTSYTNISTKKNTKYYYKVKAVCASNSNANSAQSTAVSIKATK